jgi:hypothetical protein
MNLIRASLERGENARRVFRITLDGFLLNGQPVDGESVPDDGVRVVEAVNDRNFDTVKAADGSVSIQFDHKATSRLRWRYRSMRTMILSSASRSMG